ncbi:MAG: Bax inhibitor-1/YccA family protein [Clostridia bacterium]|nr:Bax inhibitor-1/YccA family protein [Clostridia bacterium]
MSEIENSENNVIQKEPNFIAKTFFWMFLGLLATGIVSVYTYSSGLLQNAVFGEMFAVVSIVEIVVVLLFSFLFRKLPPAVVGILYFIYAILNGFGLSVIFATFELESIYMLFFAAAATFGIFAFIGYKTKIDLTKIGHILLGVLFVGIILSVVNLFMGSSMMTIALSWLILIIFFGITAYDMQRIKKWSQTPELHAEKLHIYAAMEIYLDFINIFIKLLAIFGKRK